MHFDYDSTTSTREDILNHDTLKTINKDCAHFLHNAMNMIRSQRHQEYEKCYRELIRSKNLMISLERALLTYDILISYSSFDFSILLIVFRYLIHLFASFLYDILCFLISINSEVTTRTRRSSSLRKIKSIYFNLFKSVIQIRSKLC